MELSEKDHIQSLRDKLYNHSNWFVVRYRSLTYYTFQTVLFIFLFIF